MPETKTKPSAVSVESFLAGVEDGTRRSDGQAEKSISTTGSSIGVPSPQTGTWNSRPSIKSSTSAGWS